MRLIIVIFYATFFSTEPATGTHGGQIAWVLAYPDSVRPPPDGIGTVVPVESSAHNNQPPVTACLQISYQTANLAHTVAASGCHMPAEWTEREGWWPRGGGEIVVPEPLCH